MDFQVRSQVKKLYLGLCLLGLASCASGPYGLHRSSAYENFLDSRLQTKRLYSEGRAILQIKVIPADQELINEQEKLFPQQSVQINPTNKSNFIIAMTQLGRDPLVSAEVKFELDGKRSNRVKEYQDQTAIEAHYPFAYPFHRVFLVSFEAPMTASSKLGVYAPVGSLEFSNFATSSGGNP